jgi:hypothetical protein
MSGKIGIFRGKSFERSFSQEIWRKIPRKVIFRRKNVRKFAQSGRPDCQANFEYFVTAKDESNDKYILWKEQGCQIFLDTIYQNGKIYLPNDSNKPNDHKIYQIAVK